MLELHGVTKRYGETLAVDKVSFRCERGELIGIIGRTHGVRFKARPPRNTIARIIAGPRPSNAPGRLTPASASRMNCRNSAEFE